MNQLEAEMVLKYIEEHLPLEEKFLNKNAAKERSYSRWAAYELVERFMDHPFDPPEVIVDSFLIELMWYSKMSNDEHKNRLWMAAIDAVEDISCLLE